MHAFSADAYFKKKLFLKRKVDDDDVDDYLKSKRASKRTYIPETVDTNNIVITEAAKLLISGTPSKKDRKSPHELENAQWWTQGYLSWDEEEFVTRLRINRATFEYLLAEIGPFIVKVPSNRIQFSKNIDKLP